MANGGFRLNRQKLMSSRLYERRQTILKELQTNLITLNIWQNV